MRYTIYQLPHNSHRLFMDYDGQETINLGDYARVWRGNTEEDSNNVIRVLDEIFYIFNMARPSNFAGHSLSVSDIVELDHKLYYCNSVGWKEIKEWH